jgi:PAS domain S-box-containing protein
MIPKPPSSSTDTGLRRDAEARLRKRSRQVAAAATRRSATDSQQLLHELQVHQVELELQNAELENARDRMETLLEKYTDLYDFAPVGYFSLDEQARIVEVNLTGAALLGVDRNQLMRRGLPRFIVPASQAIFGDFLHRVFSSMEKQICEIALKKEDGTLFWANVHGMPATVTSSSQPCCRLTISDITSLKAAQEAQSRMEALTVSTRALKQEIAQRQAVEAALRASEAHQRELLDQSRQAQEQLRHLSHRMLHTQEDERKRISRELHDEITQTLVGINVSLEALRQEATVNPSALRRKIVRTQRLVAKSVDIVHRFARQLRPPSLDDLGLIVSLHSLMKEFGKRSGLRVHFTTFAEVEQLSSARRTALYRIVHAALTNVAQHAAASRVTVTIQKIRNSVRMEITDNGKSFHAKQMPHRDRNKHLGLLGMRERVEMVGGKLDIDSHPDRGTTIRVQIPFGRNRASESGMTEPMEPTM